MTLKTAAVGYNAHSSTNALLKKFAGNLQQEFQPANYAEVLGELDSKAENGYFSFKNTDSIVKRLGLNSGEFGEVWPKETVPDPDAGSQPSKLRFPKQEPKECLPIDDVKRIIASLVASRREEIGWSLLADVPESEKAQAKELIKSGEFPIFERDIHAFEKRFNIQVPIDKLEPLLQAHVPPPQIVKLKYVFGSK